MRERNLHRRRRAQYSRNSWHDFDFNSGLAQGFHLFPAPAKDEWIAAFKSHYAKSEQRVSDQELVDICLSRTRLAASLSDVHQVGGGRNKAQNFRAYELVVKHHLSGA
jgi:hypothetical protein